MAAVLSILLDGTQLASRLVGELTIDLQASQARLCKLSYRPAVAPARRALVGLTLTVDIDGVRRFTGRVERAPRDITTGIITVTATDRLQQAAQVMTEAQILAAIPGGYYLQAADGVRQSGWEQLLSVISTVAGDYDLAADGATGRFHAWSVGAPAATYTAYIDGTWSEEEPDGSALINRVDIVFEYRFARLRQREIAVSWSAPDTFCEWFVDRYLLPTIGEIETAARGTDWRVKQGADSWSSLSEQAGISHTGLPATPSSGMVGCSGLNAAYNLDTVIENGASACLTAGWTAVYRAAQWVTERYRVRVESPTSQTLYGLMTAELRHAYECPFDTTAWDKSAGTTIPDGATLDALGDHVVEAADLTILTSSLAGLIGRARRQILEPHRQWTATFSIPLAAARDLGEIIELNCADVHVIGQAARVTHTIDTTGSRGERTTLTLAVRQGDPGASQEDTIGAITRLDSAPTHAAPSHTLTLQTHIGSDDAAPDYDATWTGWITNYVSAVGHLADPLEPDDPRLYPVGFSVEYPAIEAQVREALEVETPEASPLVYQVAIGHDTFA